MEDKAAKIGMVLFLAAEAMFFAGLLSAYLILRVQVVPWPPTGQPRLPVLVTGINTLILLTSGVALFCGGRALKKSCNLCLVGWIGIGALCGTLFLAIQGYEWVRLIGFGLTTVKNIYGGLFYLVVGTHAVHLLAALVVLLIVFLKAVQGRYTAAHQTGFVVFRMYWTFVVLVWPVIYGLLYF